MKKNKRNVNQEMMLHFMLKETTCEMLTKMMIAYVLHMPKGDAHYYEKINTTVEFLEECLPAHPGAFSAYFKILDCMPATTTRKIPAEMMGFIEENKEEIEKYYGEPLPSKYLPSKIIQQSKVLVDATGMPINKEPLILV